MALDPVSAKMLQTGASVGVKPTLEFLRTQYRRRGAEFADISTLAGAEPELAEAIAVLRGTASSLPASLVAKLKGLLSARPEVFADAGAQAFLDDDRVIELIKSGARRTLQGDDIPQERNSARAIHAEIFGDDGVFGERLIEDGIAFATLTLLAHLTPADRLTVELLAQLLDEMSARFDRLDEKIGGLKISADFGGLESDPYDQTVREETRRLRRQRMLQLPDYAERALALGARIESGLHLAEPTLKSEAFREIAVALSRAKRIAEAEQWILKAEALGGDATCERARALMAGEDWDAALRALRDRTDPVSRSLLLDALALRDGEGSSLTYYETHFGPHDVTGPALQVIAVRMINAGRPVDALALLEQASGQQIDDNPVVLFLRARLKMAQALAPDVAERILKYEGMLPRRADLHADETGRRQLAEARVDLQQLQSNLAGLDADDLSILVDLNLTLLGLCASDVAEQEVARREFIARVNDPAQTTLLAPLATLFEVTIDWSTLKQALAEAEALGGFDDEQVRAAFALVMNEGDPPAIADFAHRYRERLEQYSTSDSVVAIEIEAIAKSGRLDDAKTLLDAERATVGESTYAFLAATIAELEGADSLPMRLSQFEASQSTHDLEILTISLREARDARLGEYLIELWRRRRQVADARDACDALIMAVEEVRVEEFLEELGEEARADAALRTHLAWARYRQGRLQEAELELLALEAGGVDTYNTRHLRIRLLVETGRWAELESFAQKQLAASSERSAFELLEAAGIARIRGSSVTLELLRVAVAKDPLDVAVNLQAYTIATEAGCERTSEVSGWLTAAIEGDQGKLIQSKPFNEAVELIRGAREESERIAGLINAADIPVAMGIGRMGGTQSALVLSQMASNAEQADSRRRTVVPLFAGNRVPQTALQPRSISFDPLALLVLDYLGLLETAIGAFEDVVLPSQTLHAFFEDLGKAGHSQPSRVDQARLVKEAISNNQLTVETLAPASSESVDEEFAALVAAAEARNGYVVENSPLHPPGKIDEIVDPSPYAGLLLSPKGLVQALQTIGVISQAAGNAMRSAMAGSGDPWPSEPELEPNRPLFLTTLAVQYLTDAGMLPALKGYAGALIVQKQTVDIADGEIAASEMAKKIRDGIERVRAALADALASGRARVGPARRFKDEIDRTDGEQNTGIAPIMSVLRDSAGIDAFVCDDRAMNKYAQATDRHGNAPAFLTTADLLGILHKERKLDESALDAARENLRRGGAGLMPIDPNEITRASAASNWRIGPNAELRAMRDSIHLPLARRVVQLPNERAWFKAVSLAVALAIRSVWKEIDDDDDARRAASYLFDMIPDPAASSTDDESPDRDAWIMDVSRHTLWALASVFDLADSRAEAYRQWFAAYIEPKYAKRDPLALEAVAHTIYSHLVRPLEGEGADDE